MKDADVLSIFAIKYAASIRHPGRGRGALYRLAAIGTQRHNVNVFSGFFVDGNGLLAH